MSKKMSLAVTGGVLSVVVASLLLALASGAFGGGSGQPAGVELSKASTQAVSGPQAGSTVIGATTISRPESKIAPNQSEAASGTSAGDGIKVHGHWTIGVREADGSFVSRREFENALTVGGGFRLANLLGRIYGVGEWTVRFSDVSGNSNHPCFNGVSPAPCIIFEPLDDDVDNLFYNLTVEVPSSGANQDKLVLNGQATTQRDGTVNRVTLFQNSCEGTVAPVDCPTAAGVPKTSVDLTRQDIADLAVQVGQQILATVVLSFS